MDVKLKMVDVISKAQFACPRNRMAMNQGLMSAIPDIFTARALGLLSLGLCPSHTRPCAKPRNRESSARLWPCPGPDHSLGASLLQWVPQEGYENRVNVYNSFGQEADKRHLKKSLSVSPRKGPLVPLLGLPVNLLSRLRLWAAGAGLGGDRGEGDGEGRSVPSSSGLSGPCGTHRTLPRHKATQSVRAPR